MVFLYLLPANAQEQEQLGRNKERSVLGGVVFLVVLLGSLLWTIYTALWKLAAGGSSDDESYYY